MKFCKLGRTGLDVSRITLGCMTFGEPGRGAHPWTLPEDASRPLIRKAVELGINFFDTANSYSDGTSEEIVGKALKEFARRDEIVLATKVFYPWHKGPNGRGLSRKAILAAADASLRRLGMEYIDLYQIHRWDKETPIEETLGALDSLVQSGKVRYIGASSMFAWQFLKALHASERHELARFVSMQDHYNLLNREEEREMLPLCQAEGMGVLPWSPLARGRLARDWNEQTYRTESDEFGKTLYRNAMESDRQIIEAVGKISTGRGIPRSQIALAWLLHKPAVTSPIVGASKAGHLDDAIAALDVKLTADEIQSLEQPYTPHPVVGFS